MRTTALATGILALTATPLFAQENEGSLGADQMQADLCEMGYARYDSNGDGQLSPSELSEGSTVAFGQLDADSNNAISRSEYVDCVNKMAGTQSAGADRNADNMGTIDANGDGALSQQEFMQATSASYEAMKQGDAEANGDFRRLVFVPVSAGPEVYDSMTMEDAAARSAILFMALDTDQSDSVSASEWEESTPEARNRSEAAGAEFDAADTDGSGDLSAAEYERMSLENAKSAMEDVQRDAGDNEQSASNQNSQEGGNVSPDVPVVYYTYDSMM
ncbi:hypothetical protein [Allosediminivita pacifica]|uniref:EF hand domain-containing protein n=1 Tax=Allosediminivita pacifica TaxID=1267769 RepID=A0A2T6B9W1_9RHOB|nr:hypothetical protein [Allosediminivita pacifica]PTX52860.1 EF hand domain-containing protein [Allosediminivita pacifica]GGA95241.1 hypothetical protein GCM10011324_01940 [Allosediminivita pacifica]